jgi:membrane protease YdiL (CAAX protease family)
VGEMTPPVEPPREAPLWPVGIALLVLVTGSVLLHVVALVLVPGWGGDGVRPRFASLELLLLAAALSSGWIGAVAVVAALRSPQPFAERLGLVRPRGFGFVEGAVALAGALAVSHAADLALRLSGAGRGAPLTTMIDLLGGARGARLAAAVLLIGGVTGLVEELFFRGYVQRRLVHRLGAATGVLGAALLFAFVHSDPQHSAFAFAFGIYVGAIALWSGSTWPAIVLHAVNNTVSVLLAARGVDRAATIPPGGHAVAWASLAGLVVVVALAAWWVRRAARRAAA